MTTQSQAEKKSIHGFFIDSFISDGSQFLKTIWDQSYVKSRLEDIYKFEVGCLWKYEFRDMWE